MFLRRHFTLSNTLETLVLVAFLTCILFSPKIVDASFELIDQQVKRLETFSDQVSTQCSLYANQLIR